MGPVTCKNDGHAEFKIMANEGYTPFFASFNVAEVIMENNEYYVGEGGGVFVCSAVMTLFYLVVILFFALN